jgi:hypothetical protein
VERAAVDSARLKAMAGQYLWNEQVPLSIQYDEDADQIVPIFRNGDAYRTTPVASSRNEAQFIHEDSGVQMAFLDSDDLNEFRLYGQLASRSEPN